MDLKYVSLHHHSTYSYMDGYGLPDTHVKRAADLGMHAIALTEHGNVSSHVKLEKATKEHGIKPIFGLEAYMAPANMREIKSTRKWHQTILAMNSTGLQNLYQLTTRSWAEGFYQWPSIHPRWLKEHNEGLIVLSGCLDSWIACTLLGGKGREHGDKDEAEHLLLRYMDIFGDRFYLECQRFPALPRAHALNQQFEEWHHEYGVSLVATADCHYPFAEDNEMQKILHAAGRSTGTVAAAEASWEYGILLTHPKTDMEIYNDLRATGLSVKAAKHAILSTAEIAERCNVELPKMDLLTYPMEDEPNWVPGMTLEQMMYKWINEGWKYRGYHRKSKALQKEAKQRVKYEMDLFIQKGFLDYFAMLSDTVRHCKDNGLPVGPARGSAAASFVCYLLRITEVDPLLFPLMLFERFVAPNRADYPDIDLDFDDERRDEIRQYMIQKYGEDRVGNIGTFTRYRGKNAIDDVARVYQIPEYETKKVKEFLVERSGGDSRFDASIEDTVAMFPQAQAVFEEFPQLNASLRLEGNYKSFGVHAAGVVVGAEPLHNYVASYQKVVGKQKNVMQVLSVDKKDGEYLGLMKVDILGLTTMGMISNALDIIGMSLEELYNIPLDDPKSLAAFEVGDVAGIFQFEGRTMKMVTQEMRPKSFMDLAAINALARPGPLHSGSTGDYIAIRHGRQEREDFHPLITEICSTTEGQIIYQEQILKICGDVGGLSWTHRDAIRRVISNRQGESAFNALWTEFRDGAATKGISEEIAKEYWKRMVTAGTYAFNVAHCISYSMLGFWSMWLKVHHPIAFYTAQLRKASTDPKVRKDLALMRDMQDERFDRDIPVLPPHPMESGATWMPTADGRGVRAGFEQVPGIGEKTAELIVSTRDEMLEMGGAPWEWQDLQQIKGIGPKTIEKITDFVGEVDPFGINKVRDDRAAIVAEIRKRGNGDLPGLPLPNTMADEIPYDNKASNHVILAIMKNRNLQDLFENYRSRTGDELDPKTVKDPHLKDSMTLYLEDPSGMITVKVNRWTYPRMKDDLWSAKLNHDFVLVEGYKRGFYGKTLTANRIYVVDPD